MDTIASIQPAPNEYCGFVCTGKRYLYDKRTHYLFNEHQISISFDQNVYSFYSSDIFIHKPSNYSKYELDEDREKLKEIMFDLLDELVYKMTGKKINRRCAKMSYHREINEYKPRVYISISHFDGLIVFVSVGEPWNKKEFNSLEFAKKVMERISEVFKVEKEVEIA